MVQLEVKKHGDTFELVLYYKRQRGPFYSNVLRGDPKLLAQVLEDLENIGDLPIEKAVRIYMDRKGSKDWFHV